jgi:monoamine oxidase
MSILSRRSFLAASAAVATAPTVGTAAGLGDVDIAIVGAGAAGLAAARRIVAARRRCVIVEAADRIGGRCVTDTRTFGMPWDRGAHWLHTPDINPIVRLAGQTGLDIYPAPPGQKIRIGRRYAREGEMEDFLAALVRTHRAIGEASRKNDVSCVQALPKDLFDWRQTVEFVLGPFGCSKDLADVSAQDFSRAVERDSDAFCRQGLGTLIAKLADGLPVQLNAPATRIDLTGRGPGAVEIETPRGRVTARGVIVTASTGVLAAGKIKFAPETAPKRQLDAASSLRLGSYDRIVLELPNNPLGLERDDLVFEKAQGTRTAAVLANVAGSPLVTVDVGGKFGRELAGKGEAAMTAFALDWLGDLFGADLRKAVKRTAATQWNAEPWVLGAVAAAAPGGLQARRTLIDTLLEPVRGRLWFAGEAVHETLWGTVAGAWESGERAAELALKKFGWVAEPREPARAPQRRQR